MGVTAFAAQEAEREHNAKAREAQRKGRKMEPFSLENWLKKARKKPVRSKPYELESAAYACAELAKKSGWLGVEVRAISKGSEKPFAGAQPCQAFHPAA